MYLMPDPHQRYTGYIKDNHPEKVRQDTKMMTPSFPASILAGSMKRTSKKMGGNSNGESNHHPRGGFWYEFAQAWKWLNMLALPAALVFVAIMVVVESINGNLEKGVTLGLMFIAIAEIACTFMTFFTQVISSVLDWIDRRDSM